jgi:hypothetical protein
MIPTHRFDRAGIYMLKRLRRSGATIDIPQWLLDRRISLAAVSQCVYCWHCAPVMTLDHVEPLSRGGSRAASNVAFVCERCNHSKGNLFPLEWVLSGCAPGHDRDRASTVVALFPPPPAADGGRDG